MSELRLIENDAWTEAAWEASAASRAASKLKDAPMKPRSAIINVQLPYGNQPSKPVEVLINPSDRDVMKFARETQFSELRSTHDQHGNIYLWQAEHAMHGHMVNALAEHGAAFDLTQTQTAGENWYLSRVIAPSLQDQLRAARMVARTAVADASPVRAASDPTRTKGLRRAFRSAAFMQLNQLRSNLRNAIVDYNMLGLAGSGSSGIMQSPAARLQQFLDWFESAAFASMDARWWVAPWLDKAIASGLVRAQREVDPDNREPLQIYQGTFAALQHLAAREVDGIVAALAQKLARQAHNAVASRKRSTQVFAHMAKTIDTDTKTRLKAFTNSMTVKAHNVAKIETYRNNGITKVGINPEHYNHASTRKLVDHRFHVRDDNGDDEDTDLVGIVTAGDDLVCEECEDAADDSPYSLDEAQDLLPLHPNCRCAVFPWEDERYAGDSLTVDEFEEAAHPREAAGSPEGGRFAPAGGGEAKKTKIKGDLKKIVAQNSNEQAVDRLAEVLSAHNVEAEDFEKAMFAGLGPLKSKPVLGKYAYHGGEDSVIVSGSFGQTGSVSRGIDFGNSTATHEYLSLDDSVQGRGVAKQLLASQISMYQKLGINKVKLHANIDVGGYAWAKYGFVPNIGSWQSLQEEMRQKIDGSYESYVAQSWDEMTEAEQDLAETEYINNNLRSEIDFYEENWRNEDALDDARSKLAEDFNRGEDMKWATKAIEKKMARRAELGKPAIPFTSEQLVDALQVEHDSGHSGDRGTTMDWDDAKLDEQDINANQHTLPGFEAVKPSERLTPEMRSDLEGSLFAAFRDRAHDVVSDLEPPSYLEDSAREGLQEGWRTMDDDDRYRYVSRNTSILEEREQSHEAGEVHIDPNDLPAINKLINSDDPKAIWGIADSAYGKKLLLNSDWEGTLNLKDPRAFARFNDYVNKKRKS